MQSMGIELGEVFTKNEHNKKGNRENARITKTNDILLRLAGGSWTQPVAVNEWNDAARAERDSIIAEIKTTGSTHWGFKDPRAMFTLPFWLEAEPDMKFIGTYRHPYRTALSLLKRDKTPIEEGMKIWKAYNVRMLELLQNRQFDIVNFDLDQPAYLDDAIAKLIKLGIDSGKSEAARGFFDASLRNQTNEQVDDFELPADIAATYQALNAYFESH
jgi:hypothetical protein